MKVVDLTGQRFGRLVVVERVASQRDGKAWWLCRCDCGNSRETASTDLRSKRRPIVSCGCARSIQYQPGEVVCQVTTPRFPQGRTGTLAGYRAHRKARQEPCRQCMNANTAVGRARIAGQSQEQHARGRATARLAEARYREKLKREGRKPKRKEPPKPSVIVMLDGLPACYYPSAKHPKGRTGTRAGYQIHAKFGEEPCRACASTQQEIGQAYWQGLSGEEREVVRERNREETARYRLNSPGKALAAKDRYMATNRQIIRAAKDVPCTDCGIKYPYYVMQFDHLGIEKKEFNIAQGPTVSREKLLTEIAKCEVVCANCHFARTHKRDQYFGRRRRRDVPGRSKAVAPE